ncbi:MAG: hypothetical protein HC783_18710 [Rhodobacteraceae bacterium]|nr:hypothetical protein [Paracoccaceae bacterium]
MTNQKTTTTRDQGKATVSRRQLLARVGLIAGAAYVAPVMAGFNAAQASTGSGASGGGSSNSGPSNSGQSNSGPSNSGPSSSSGPSRGRRRRDAGGNADLPPWMQRILGV